MATVVVILILKQKKNTSDPVPVPDTEEPVKEISAENDDTIEDDKPKVEFSPVIEYINETPEE